MLVRGYEAMMDLVEAATGAPLAPLRPSLDSHSFRTAPSSSSSDLTYSDMNVTTHKSDVVPLTAQAGGRRTEPVPDIVHNNTTDKASYSQAIADELIAHTVSSLIDIHNKHTLVDVTIS